MKSTLCGCQENVLEKNYKIANTEHISSILILISNKGIFRVLQARIL